VFQEDRNRIGIIVSSDYALENVISLIDGVNALAELGYRLDVLAPVDNLIPVNFQTNQVQLYPIHRGWGKKDDSTAVSEPIAGSPDWKVFPANRLRHVAEQVRGIQIFSDPLSLVIRSLRWFKHMRELIHIFATPVPYWLRLTRGKSYLCFIGVEPGGLVVATIAGILRGVPVVYYNMELSLSHEINERHKLLIKWFERKCNRKAVLTLIQDEARAQLLCQDNHIPLSRMALIPCGVMGPSFAQQTDYLRQKYGISANKKILLYAGKIAHWARIAELAQQVEHWPDGWVLVIHGFPAVGQYVEEIRHVVSASSGRLVLSTEMLPQDQFESLLSSADMGIALYEDQGANFRHTGSASHKLALYLKCGLPVITSDFPSLRQIIEGYGCGVCVSDESQVILAAGQIMADYQRFRTNVRKCFNEHFDIRPHWHRVMTNLKRIRILSLPDKLQA